MEFKDKLEEKEWITRDSGVRLGLFYETTLLKITDDFGS